MYVSHHLLLAITLQPTSEKEKFLYLRSWRLSKLHFPKFEDDSYFVKKNLFFHPPGKSN